MKWGCLGWLSWVPARPSFHLGAAANSLDLRRFLKMNEYVRDEHPEHHCEHEPAEDRRECRHAGTDHERAQFDTALGYGAVLFGADPVTHLRGILRMPRRP